jgi:hypothetical protein
MSPKKESEVEKTARLRAARLAREAADKRPKPRPDPTRLWGLDDELTFGKHKGRTIREVIDEDRGWLVWLLENSDRFALNAAAQAEFDAADDPRRPPRAWEVNRA